jgi:tripeptide aminopeptidase
LHLSKTVWGRGNLKGIRQLLEAWPTPIQGAICLESVELGRAQLLFQRYDPGRNQNAVSFLKGKMGPAPSHRTRFMVINEVINAILGLRLPQKPRTQIVIGKIDGGFNHGKVAYDANIGFEIRSDSDEIVKELYSDIRDIVDDINKAFAVDLRLSRISNLNATHLPYNHPLVKSASRILNQLGVEAVSEPQ